MAKAKNFSTFEQWHALDVNKLLNVRPAKASDLLHQWINVEPFIPERWTETIAFYRQQLEVQHTFWNETELLGNFIIPFLATLEWFNENFNLFNQRPLRANVRGYNVDGVVDGMVAAGSYEPEKPYFSFRNTSGCKKANPTRWDKF